MLVWLLLPNRSSINNYLRHLRAHKVDLFLGRTMLITDFLPFLTLLLKKLRYWIQNRSSQVVKAKQTDVFVTLK